MTRFAIIDLANLFYRARHVVRGDAFTKAGMAMHIVFRSLKRLHRERQVDHMVLAIEGGSWRYKVYPQYKARRKLDRAAMSARDKEEDEVFNEVLNDFTTFMAEKTRATVLYQPGVEGDDFVARWVQLHPDDEHIILSGDSDFVQLIADNVSIYDGVNERTITKDGVFDTKGNRLSFSIEPGSGKLKVGVPDPYFVPEPDWPKKALFVKIIRGDPGDGIFSACPGARFEGSSKRGGIREAWDDRHEKGFNWNNFFLQSWDKLGRDEAGNEIVQKVRVLDEYAINESLIDLTKQPETVKDLMDKTILDAVQKEPVGNIGIHFMRFCDRHNLPALLKDSNDHAAYLNAPYIKKGN